MATEPLGHETLTAIGTSEALPQRFLARAGTAKQVRGPAAERFQIDLLEELVRRGPDAVDIARATYEVVAADSPRRYSSRGIIAHFTSRTRSLTRPKLDLDIQFEFDSDALTSRARRDLDEVGRALASHEMRGRRFELSGHTDDVGDDAYNLELSRRRAEAARAYLIDRFQLAAGSVTAQGYGESRPVRPGGGPADRRLNRRVVLELLR